MGRFVLEQVRVIAKGNESITIENDATGNPSRIVISGPMEIYPLGSEGLTFRLFQNVFTNVDLKGLPPPVLVVSIPAREEEEEEYDA